MYKSVDSNEKSTLPEVIVNYQTLADKGEQYFEKCGGVLEEQFMGIKLFRTYKY